MLPLHHRVIASPPPSGPCGPRATVSVSIRMSRLQTHREARTFHREAGRPAADIYPHAPCERANPGRGDAGNAEVYSRPSSAVNADMPGTERQALVSFQYSRILPEPKRLMLAKPQSREEESD